MSVDIIATGVGVIGAPTTVMQTPPTAIIESTGFIGEPSVLVESGSIIMIESGGIIGEPSVLMLSGQTILVESPGIIGAPSVLIGTVPDIRVESPGIIGSPSVVLQSMQPINGLFNAIVTEVTGLGTLPFAEGVFESFLIFAGLGSNVSFAVGSFESPIRQKVSGTGVSLGNSWLAWFKAFNEV